MINQYFFFEKAQGSLGRGGYGSGKTKLEAYHVAYRRHRIAKKIEETLSSGWWKYATVQMGSIKIAIKRGDDGLYYTRLGKVVMRSDLILTCERIAKTLNEHGHLLVCYQYAGFATYSTDIPF